MAHSPLILVTGAAGALGRLVVAELAASGHNVVAGTRQPDRAAPHLPAGVERRRVDFDDAASLRNGLRGVQRLLVISTDELGEPGRRQRQHRAALDGARAAGVTFIAYTSMPDPTNAASIPFAPDHVATERDLAQGATPHAVLRNAWYQENLLGYLPWIIADGSWFHAAGNGRIPYVARADVARAAASVLADARAGIFDVAGPAALTVQAIADAVGETLHRMLAVVPAEPDRVALELARQGVPVPVIPMVSSTEAHGRNGGFDIASDAVARLTGRPARTIAEFLRTNAELLLAPTR